MDLSDQKRCNLLNNNPDWVIIPRLKNTSTLYWKCLATSTGPVLVAKHFQYKFEVFFKEIILDGPLEESKIWYTYYICPFIYMDFQCTKYWKWSCLHRVHWENSKCTVARRFELSRPFWVSLDLPSSCSL